MANLIKSNLYKLFKRKSLYIFSMIYTALSCMSIFILKIADEIRNKTAGASEDMAIKVEGRLSNFNDGLSLGVEFIVNGEALIFLAVFTAMFIAAEFTHGTIKNIASKGFKRKKIYKSIFFSMVVATIIMLGINFIFTTMVGTLVTGSIGIGNIDKLLLFKIIRLVIIEVLLHIAMVSLFVMVTMIFRSSGVAITINLCLLVFGSAYYQFIETIVRYILKTDKELNLINYGIQKNMYLAKATVNGGDIKQPLIVAVVFLITSLIFGTIAFKRSDIR